MSSSPYNWQAEKPSVQDAISFLFNNEILSDVHFMVGKGTQRRRIPAHKFVLAVRSAVFDAMFNGGISAQSDEVELPDVEYSAFQSLLRFLYTDEVQIGPETVMTTLYTAKKYAVPTLENACVDFLKKNLSADNAFMLLSQARLFDEPQLAALCLECIDKNTTEALAAEGFTDIDFDTFCVVLQRDTLSIRENQLFAAALRWAEHECQRRRIPSTSENKRSDYKQYWFFRPGFKTVSSQHELHAQQRPYLISAGSFLRMSKLNKQKEGTAGRSVLNVSFFHARNVEPCSVLFCVSLSFNSMSFVTIKQ